MTETVYSTTETFGNISGDRMVSVDANGGSLVIDVEHGSGNWVTVQTFSDDGAKVMYFGYGRTFRFTVSGGATYAL